MVCDLVVVLCVMCLFVHTGCRFEIYVGKKMDHDSDQSAFDNLTGPAAVTRNMKVVLQARQGGWHAVVIDRFYSSVVLCLQLLSMQVYVLGTCRTDRIGYDKQVVVRTKGRPASVPHGAFKVTRSAIMPQLMCTMWYDKKPVYFVSTGSTACEAQVVR